MSCNHITATLDHGCTNLFPWCLMLHALFSFRSYCTTVSFSSAPAYVCLSPSSLSFVLLLLLPHRVWIIPSRSFILSVRPTLFLPPLLLKHSPVKIPISTMKFFLAALALAAIGANTQVNSHSLCLLPACSIFRNTNWQLSSPSLPSWPLAGPLALQLRQTKWSLAARRPWKPHLVHPSSSAVSPWMQQAAWPPVPPHLPISLEAPTTLLHLLEALLLLLPPSPSCCEDRRLRTRVRGLLRRAKCSWFVNGVLYYVHSGVFDWR